MRLEAVESTVNDKYPDIPSLSPAQCMVNSDESINGAFSEKTKQWHAYGTTAEHSVNCAVMTVMLEITGPPCMRHLQSDKSCKCFSFKVAEMPNVSTSNVDDKTMKEDR